MSQGILCQFKDIFGRPGQGVHSYRLFGVAVVDVVLTLMAAFLIKWIKPQYNLAVVTVALFLLGIFMHWLFCVDTAFNRFLASLLD